MNYCESSYLKKSEGPCCLTYGMGVVQRQFIEHICIFLKIDCTLIFNLSVM